jgi:hypothetical protein
MKTLANESYVWFVTPTGGEEATRRKEERKQGNRRQEDRQGDKGDKETRRQGDKETRRQGDKETRKQPDKGDKETRRQEDKETRRQGDKGDKETKRRLVSGFPACSSSTSSCDLLLKQSKVVSFDVAVINVGVSTGL